MRLKLILMTLAILLPLSSFASNAEESPHKQEIPLTPVIVNGGLDNNNRSLVQLPVECCYFRMMNIIVTTVLSDVGDVTLTVTNCSTGSVWHSSFDSAMEPQTMLTLSGDSGIYQIMYIIESGSTYVGNFTIQ